MAVRLSVERARGFPSLRYEPTAKRVRALVGDRPIVDTRSAMLVWEPGRVVPQYAVPEADLHAELLPADTGEAPAAKPVRLGRDGPPVLDPRTPFLVHSCQGEPLTVVAGDVSVAGAAFRPADPDLAGYVVLEFRAFDWLEEDQPVISHPHDPYSRIDVLRSDAHIQVSVGDVVLVDSTRTRMLYETGLPARCYVPREDVRFDLLVPSQTRTSCAYKGHASYWSAVVDGCEHADLAWSYEDPLADALDVRDHVAFFDERVDVVVDDVPRERPVSPWS